MDDKQREDFERWANDIGFKSDWDRGITWRAWQEQQKRIEALKEELSGCYTTNEVANKEIEALKRELAETKEVEIKACNFAAELDTKNTELEKEVNEQHEQIMRLRILLETAHEVIRSKAPGFRTLIANIEVTLYGEKQ